MIHVLLREADGSYVEGGEELIARWRADTATRLWLDIEEEPSDRLRDFLVGMDCDELAINDSFRSRHPPKVEHFADNTFILFRGIASLDQRLDLKPQQLGLWVGARSVVTLHRGHSISVDRLWDEEPKAGLLEEPGELALRVIHFACGRYLEKLLEFEAQLAELEDGLLTSRSEEDMKELVIYRTRLRKLRRVFNYHHTLAEQVLRAGGPYLDTGAEGLEHVRRDVFDRCERLSSLSHMYYELCGDLIEGHISLSSHKLNETMKVLTIISALFVPLTFLAGIYGMNFENMPELGWRYGYFTVIGLMAVMATGMLVLFRRIRWL